MVMTTPRDIAPATGRLGVLTPGLGAVASTFIAGVIAARQGLQPPIGSVSQMAHIRLGTKEDGRNPLIREFVPLADLDDIVFGGWDPISPNALEAARTCGVLNESDLAAISSELEGVVPMDAVFDQEWVSRLEGVRVKDIPNKWDQAMALIDDIAAFNRARRQAPSLIDPGRMVVLKKSRRSAGPVYTARLGYPSRNAARKSCLRIRRAGLTCYLRRN